MLTPERQAMGVSPMDPSSAADDQVKANPTTDGATPSTKGPPSTDKDSSAKTLVRALRASFNSPVRKVIWGVLSVTAVILGVTIPVFGFFDHEPQISLEAQWLSISNPEVLQTPFNLFPSKATAESPTSTTLWLALYSITNSGNQVITLKDISLDLPFDHSPSGESVQLKRTASGTMTVYAGYTDWEQVHNIKNWIQRSNEEYQRTFDRPILLEPGQTYYIEYGQRFAFDLNGKPWRFTGDPELAYLLGQYFSLDRNANGTFKCGSVRIPTSIETTNGIMHKPVAYFISFPGCTVSV
jgi:hypothetical protein